MGLLVSSVIALALAGPPQAAPLTSPFQLVVEPRGTLLVADGGSGRIVRVDPRTGRRSLFAQGLGTVYALAYGPGGLYATTKTQVVRFSGGKRQTLVRGLHDPIGLAVARDGTIYVAESTLNRVVRFEGSKRARSVVASAGLDQPLGLTLDVDGSLLVCDSRHGRIVEVGEGGALEPVLEGLGLPVGLTTSGGAVYVVDHVRHDLAGKILRLHPDGTTDTLSSGTIHAVSAVAVGRGGALYAASFLPPYVGRLDAAGRLVPFSA